MNYLNPPIVITKGLGRRTRKIQAWSKNLNGASKGKLQSSVRATLIPKDKATPEERKIAETMSKECWRLLETMSKECKMLLRVMSVFRVS